MGRQHKHSIPEPDSHAYQFVTVCPGYPQLKTYCFSHGLPSNIQYREIFSPHKSCEKSDSEDLRVYFASTTLYPPWWDTSSAITATTPTSR